MGGLDLGRSAVESPRLHVTATQAYEPNYTMGVLQVSLMAEEVSRRSLTDMTFVVVNNCLNAVARSYWGNHLKCSRYKSAIAVFYSNSYCMYSTVDVSVIVVFIVVPNIPIHTASYISVAWSCGGSVWKLIREHFSWRKQ